MAIRQNKIENLSTQNQSNEEKKSIIPCTNTSHMLTQFFNCNDIDKLQRLKNSISEKDSRKKIDYNYSKNEFYFDVVYNDEKKTLDNITFHINFSDYFSQTSNNSFKNFPKLFNFVFSKIFEKTVYFNELEKRFEFYRNTLEFSYLDFIDLGIFKTSKHAKKQLDLFLSKFQNFKYSNSKGIGSIAFITNYFITNDGFCKINLFTNPGETLPPCEFITLFFNAYMLLPNEYWRLDSKTASLLYEIFYKLKINENKNRNEINLYFKDILEQTFNLKIDIKNWREKLFFPIKQSAEEINNIVSNLSIELDRNVIDSNKSELLTKGKLILKKN